MLNSKDVKTGWYKFYPYFLAGKIDLSRCWYGLFNNSVHNTLEYINDSGKYYDYKGNFSDYGDAYELAIPEEINKFLPEGKKIGIYEIY